MHTDKTLDIMDTVTFDLGDKLRSFQQRTCAFFKTKELRREANARNRRQAKNVHKPGQVRSGPLSLCESYHMPMRYLPRPPQPSGSNVTSDPDHAIPTSTAQPKTFNLNTYKFHALGDYTSTIRQYGTTDSYSTEAVCAHCFYKSHSHRNPHSLSWSTVLQKLATHAQVESNL